MVAFNEAETIEAEVLSFHRAIVARLPGSEFIVAEDGSRDRTPQILKALAARIGIIHLTSAERKGYKRALLDAVLAARNPYIFFSDSGGKHNPEEFWKLYACARTTTCWWAEKQIARISSIAGGLRGATTLPCEPTSVSLRFGTPTAAFGCSTAR
jgi:glycosyltransferase involved in cell wall biosynthesis